MMKNDIRQQELFSAYLDGELTVAEQAEAERLLATDAAARQLLEELRTLSATLQGLPQQRVGEDLSQRVLRSAEERMLTGAPGSREDAPTPPLPSIWREVNWRGMLGRRALLWSGLAVAIAVMFALNDPNRHTKLVDHQMARAPEVQTPEAAPETAPETVRDGLVSSPPSIHAQGWGAKDDPVKAGKREEARKEDLKTTRENEVTGHKIAGGEIDDSTRSDRRAETVKREGAKADVAKAESKVGDLAGGRPRGQDYRDGKESGPILGPVAMLPPAEKPAAASHAARPTSPFVPGQAGTGPTAEVERKHLAESSPADSASRLMAAKESGEKPKASLAMEPKKPVAEGKPLSTPEDNGKSLGMTGRAALMKDKPGEDRDLATAPGGERALERVGKSDAGPPSGQNRVEAFKQEPPAKQELPADKPADPTASREPAPAVATRAPAAPRPSVVTPAPEPRRAPSEPLGEQPAEEAAPARRGLDAGAKKIARDEEKKPRSDAAFTIDADGLMTHLGRRPGVMVVVCNISPEAAQSQAFDDLLAANGIAMGTDAKGKLDNLMKDHDEVAAGSVDVSKNRRSRTGEAGRQQNGHRYGGKGGPAGAKPLDASGVGDADVVWVQATPDQIDRVIEQLEARPGDFHVVSKEPAPLGDAEKLDRYASQVENRPAYDPAGTPAPEEKAGFRYLSKDVRGQAVGGGQAKANLNERNIETAPEATAKKAKDRARAPAASAPTGSAMAQRLALPNGGSAFGADRGGQLSLPEKAQGLAETEGTAPGRGAGTGAGPASGPVVGKVAAPAAPATVAQGGGDSSGTVVGKVAPPAPAPMAAPAAPAARPDMEADNVRLKLTEAKSVEAKSDDQPAQEPGDASRKRQSLGDRGRAESLRGKEALKQDQPFSVGGTITEADKLARQHAEEQAPQAAQSAQSLPTRRVLFVLRVVSPAPADDSTAGPARAAKSGRAAKVAAESAPPAKEASKAAESHERSPAAK